MTARKKILVVDDDAVLLQTFSMKLVANGYDVVTAEDGASAVSQARREKPDLILLDINFPPDVAHGGGVPWDGYLIMNWLRRLDECKNTPVVFISATEAVKCQARALKAGGARFFQKPILIKELLAFIAETFAAKPTSTAPPVPGPKRVLFVDDEGDWRLVAGDCLESAGFEVVTAKDVAEALGRMEKLKLDAIILDVNLGKENGLLLIEFLKQSHPNVPIVIYTGLEKTAPELQNALREKSARYLRKGSMGELCSTIKGLVE